MKLKEAFFFGLILSSSILNLTYSAGNGIKEQAEKIVSEKSNDLNRMVQNKINPEPSFDRILDKFNDGRTLTTAEKHYLCSRAFVLGVGAGCFYKIKPTGIKVVVQSVGKMTGGILGACATMYGINEFTTNEFFKPTREFLRHYFQTQESDNDEQKSND